jgi:histidinol-phosphate phosphatase family protein
VRSGAIFLDRDGTIIEDVGYPRDPAHVRLISGAPEVLRELARDGWRLIIVSNQSGIDLGIITPEEKDAVHQRFLELMREERIQITASYFCPHAPDRQCQCRKPSPYLLQLAAREHAIDLTRSWMIGDREADMLCGKNAGCHSLWLRNDNFPGGDGEWSTVLQSIAASDNESRDA